MRHEILRYGRNPVGLCLLGLLASSAIAFQNPIDSTRKSNAPSPSPRTPISPTTAPPPGPNHGAGGTYAGPGDTVPPGANGPGQGHCETQCGFGGFGNTDCYTKCDNDNIPPGGYGPNTTQYYWNPSFLTAPSFSCVTSLSGWPAAPSCFSTTGSYRIYEITVGQLWWMLHSTSSNGTPNSTICIPIQTCPSGIDGVFIYKTIPFQYFFFGMPTGGGSNPDPSLCGMASGIHIFNVTQQQCTSYTNPGPHPTENDNGVLIPLKCTKDSITAKIHFNSMCFLNLLERYRAMGLYVPGPMGINSQTWLNDSSVVFSIAVKCCDSTGSFSCQPPYQGQ